MTGPMPSPPAALVQPAEYAWGDAIGARDERMARHVIGGLEPRFGHADEAHYVAEATALGGLQRDYAARLGEGWTVLPLTSVLGPGEQGFGFVRDQRALVVAWLPTQPDGRVPVTTFTFGEKG